MFILNITNNYVANIKFDSKKISAQGGTYTTKKITGQHTIEGKGIMDFNIIDLANRTIPGYPLDKHWGILMEYQGKEIYGRYEGTGQFSIVFDEYGNAEVSVEKGEAIVIHLPGLKLKKEDSSKTTET